jgi:hypothetical protein
MEAPLSRIAMRCPRGSVLSDGECLAPVFIVPCARARALRRERPVSIRGGIAFAFGLRAAILAGTLLAVTAGAQVTPPSGTGSPALRATTPAASATPFAKSDAVLPTGTRENRWGPFEGRVVDLRRSRG